MRHTREDLIKLLQTMDRQLNSPAHLVAMDLPYLALVTYPESGASVVPDQSSSEKLQAIHGTTCARTRINIPFNAMSFNDFPFMFETRLTELEIPGARFLKAHWLDRHDTTVARLVRGDRREISAIESLGRSSGLTYESLIESFCAIDLENRDSKKLRQQFLNLVEALFGAASVAQAEAVLAERL